MDQDQKNDQQQRQHRKSFVVWSNLGKVHEQVINIIFRSHLVCFFYLSSKCSRKFI
jgi:hypothetical protein